MTRLKTHKTCPPGEFFFKAMLSNGVVTPLYGPCKGVQGCTAFGPSPDIKAVAEMYGDFLKGNGLHGGDFATCLQAVDQYTCTRLGGNDRWCYDSDLNYAASTKAIISRTTGGCCGARL